MEFQSRKLPPILTQQCKEIFFRQSFLSDYLTCPQMSLYQWIINLEPRPPFMAAVLGTAGHEVIFQMHEERDFDMTKMELRSRFCQAFDKELDTLDKLPDLSKGYDSIEEERDAKAELYIELLDGYRKQDINRDFISVIHEQRFVLELESHDSDVPIIMTGVIDQGGVYQDGTFVIRDIKFRDNNFRPGYVQTKLNMQLSIYAAGFQFGKPACEKCMPTYEEDVFSTNLDGETKKLKYNGPCDACSAKIGTSLWPQRKIDKCEIVWMRDYEVYKKDQYARYVKDKSKKVKNPKTGRMVYADVINPKWQEGYKTGDYRGSGIISTKRTDSDLGVLMSDVVRICEEIRKGSFYRKPSDACNFWCNHRDSCMGGIELEVKELNLQDANDFCTEDF